MSAPKEQIFKTCPMCGEFWQSRESFLDDAALNFNGYQPDFGTIEEGIFYFTHEVPHCGSTMAIKAERFISLFKGEKYQESKQLTEVCTEKCLHHESLDRCPAHCLYAFVREVSQIIKDRSHRVA